MFVKWSDGVTNKTRTDANFKQNLDVTAVFAAASVKISSSGKAAVGGSCTFHAKISGKHLESYVLYLQEQGKSASTIKTDLSAIRFFHDKMSQPRYAL